MRKSGTNITTSINQFSVCYDDQGPEGAPVIIFIHGFPLNKSMWDKQIQALKNDFRVIAYDIRGFGKSGSGEQNLSIELFVNDLLTFMDELNIDKSILCGFSMGGYIALNAIENHPNHFNALILCDTNCTADMPEAKENRMKAIENIRLNGLEKYADESLKKLFTPESFSTNQAAIAAASVMIMNPPNQMMYIPLYALANREEPCHKLHDIKIPVLILVGKGDIITPPEAAKLMHEKINGSTLHIIDHAGHLSNMENPDEFNNQVTMFAAQVKSN